MSLYGPSLLTERLNMNGELIELFNDICGLMIVLTEFLFKLIITITRKVNITISPPWSDTGHTWNLEKSQNRKFQSSTTILRHHCTICKVPPHSITFVNLQHLHRFWIQLAHRPRSVHNQLALVRELPESRSLYSPIRHFFKLKQRNWNQHLPQAT